MTVMTKGGGVVVLACRMCSLSKPSTSGLHRTASCAQNIPDAVGALTALTCLDIDMDCDSPRLVANLQLPTSRMTALSSSISRLTGLQHLTVRGANLLPELPDVFGALEKLQELRLIGELTRVLSQQYSATPVWFCYRRCGVGGPPGAAARR
jgi:hypothetical protein